MKKRGGYRKLKNDKGIYQNITTGRFRVNIKVKGEPRNMTFDLLEDAILWRNECKGNTELYLEKLGKKDKCYSTLKEVYYSMQVNHFDTLAPSTKQIWNRRYELLKSIEHLTMN